MKRYFDKLYKNDAIAVAKAAPIKPNFGIKIMFIAIAIINNAIRSKVPFL
jgi:hypothetical protein